MYIFKKFLNPGYWVHRVFLRLEHNRLVFSNERIDRLRSPRRKPDVQRTLCFAPKAIMKIVSRPQPSKFWYVLIEKGHVPPSGLRHTCMILMVLLLNDRYWNHIPMNSPSLMTTSET